MALIKQFQTFRANLAGYAEIEFAEFREKVVPLKPARAWSEAQQAYVRQLMSASASYAIQQLCGVGHPAVVALIGAAALKPEPMTKAALETQVRALLQKCEAGAWPAGQYLTYINYLNNHEPLQKENLPPGIFAGRVKSSDPFADAYAVAGPAFRRIVCERFTDTAERLDAAHCAPPERPSLQCIEEEDEIEGSVKVFGS